MHRAVNIDAAIVPKGPLTEAQILNLSRWIKYRVDVREFCHWVHTYGDFSNDNKVLLLGAFRQLVLSIAFHVYPLNSDMHRRGATTTINFWESLCIIDRDLLPLVESVVIYLAQHPQQLRPDSYDDLHYGSERFSRTRPGIQRSILEASLQIAGLDDRQMRNIHFQLKHLSINATPLATVSYVSASNPITGLLDTVGTEPCLENAGAVKSFTRELALALGLNPSQIKFNRPVNIRIESSTFDRSTPPGKRPLVNAAALDSVKQSLPRLKTYINSLRMTPETDVAMHILLDVLDGLKNLSGKVIKQRCHGLINDAAVHVILQRLLRLEAIVRVQGNPDGRILCYELGDLDEALKELKRLLPSLPMTEPPPAAVIKRRPAFLRETPVSSWDALPQIRKIIDQKISTDTVSIDHFSACGPTRLRVLEQRLSDAKIVEFV